MPLTRFQIRNEYSLGDPELYRAAERDDPEALLEGVAMAGLVGVLRHLGDLAEFGAVIFHELHEEVMATAARGHGLMIRVQQLEAEVPPIEKTFLSQTNHSLFLYNAGVDWHPNLQMDQSLITRGDLPQFVMDSFEECRGPPRLFLLDKFDIAGAGACLKRYSDPLIFKAELNSSETTKEDVQREKKARKFKKKGSNWRNGKAPEVSPTSHTKLQQLFAEEHSQTKSDAPTHRVKLKKGQLNGSPFDSTTGKSYMERFLETRSPEHRVSYESSLSPSHLNMKFSGTSELDLEICEISIGSPNKFLQRERGLDSSPMRQETALEPSIHVLHADVIKGENLDELPEPNKIPPGFYKAEDQKESLLPVERKTEASSDGDQSNDITSEVNNYMDALTTMESEMETDTESKTKNGRVLFNTIRQGVDLDTNGEQQELQAQFSDSRSIGSSSASDDENNLFKEGRYNISYAATANNLVENEPPDGDAVAKMYISSEVFPAEIVDISSKKLSQIGDSSVTKSLEYVVPNSLCNEVSEIPSYRSEFLEASPNSSVTDSTSTLFLHSPAANLSEFQLRGPGSIEISMKFGTEGPSSKIEDSKNLDGDLLCTTNVSDFASQMKDDFLPIGSVKSQSVEEMDGQIPEVSSDPLLHLCNISDLELLKECDDNTFEVVALTERAADGSTENFMDGKLDSPHSVTLPTEEQLSSLTVQDLDACLSTMQPEFLPACISSGDLDDVKPDRIVVETDTGIQSTEENTEYLTSVFDIPETGDCAEQDFLKMADEVPPPECNVGAGNGCSGVRTLYNSLEVVSNTSDRKVKDEAILDVIQLSSCDSVGKAAVSLKFPSLSVVSDSAKPTSVTDFHSQVDNLVTGTARAEADDHAVMHHNLLQEECRSNIDLGDLVTEVHSQLDDSVTGTVNVEVGGDDTALCLNIIGSPSRNHINWLEECSSSNEDSGKLVTDIQSRLDNLVTGTVHVETDGADTAECQSLISSSSGNHIKLQEECPSNGDSDHCKLEITEACSPKCIIRSDAQNEANKLAVAPTDSNFEMCNPESYDSSSSELPNDVHDSRLVEHGHLICDVTRALTSSKEIYQELKSAHQTDFSESAENAMFLATHSLHEPRVPLEQALESEADRLITESLHEDGESPVPSSLLYEQTLSPNHRDRDGCFSAPSESSWLDLLKQLSEPESSEPAMETSDFPIFGMFPGTTHEQPLDSRPTRPALDILLPDPNAAQTNLEMPAFPPLPPIQWRIGKLRHGSLTLEGEIVQSSLNPFSPPLLTTTNEKAHQGFPTLRGEIEQPLNPFFSLSAIEDEKPQHGTLGGETLLPRTNPFSSQIPAMVDDANSLQGSLTLDVKMTHSLNPFMPLPSIEDEKTQHCFLTMGEEMVQPNSNPLEGARQFSFSLQEQLGDLQSLLGPKSNFEDGMLQHTSLNLEKGTVQPLNSFAPPASVKDEKLPHGSLILEGEMASTSALLPTAEVGMPTGDMPKKQFQHKDPLIDAVACHDTSMLRKVPERPRPLIGWKVDERDSLLDQIRTKSFNLKPTVIIRPNIEGPKANLKVTAILEKANAIRQALTGSDEDDDSDNWSDS